MAIMPECGEHAQRRRLPIALGQQGEYGDQHEARERSQQVGEGHYRSRPLLAHAWMSGHDQTSAWRSRATGEGKLGYRFRQE